MFATCPVCAEKVELPDGVRLSQVIDCPTCGSELEVIAADPPVLAVAPEAEEDWGE
jgi:alpha-aminoadipate/glutamate carrier protein LysW